MIKHDKKPEEVALMLNRKLATIYSWTAKNVQSQIPDELLELLEFKLNEK